MLISPYRRKKLKVQDMPTLKMNGIMLENVLGVLLDVQLNFKKHVNHIIRSVAHKVYTLGKIRRKLTKKAATDIYKTMILPIMDYGDVFYQAILRKAQSIAKQGYTHNCEHSQKGEHRNRM